MGQKPKSKRKRIGLAEVHVEVWNRGKSQRIPGELHLEKRQGIAPIADLQKQAKLVISTCLTGARVAVNILASKTGTLMENSNIKYQDWVMAIYLMGTFLKRCFKHQAGERP